MQKELVERLSKQIEHHRLENGRALRIGVDLDEVLAKFVERFLGYYFDEYGEKRCRGDMKSYNFHDNLGCTELDAYRAVHGFYSSPHFQQLKPVNGSQEAIVALSQRHELYVITARPFTIEADTIAWIESNFPKMFNGVYITGDASCEKGAFMSKADICRILGIDIIIEDSVVNASSVAEIGSIPLLLDCPWNRQDVPDVIDKQRVYSWGQIVEIINPGCGRS